MLLDVGYRLRVGEANFKHPLVTIGVIFEVATLALLLTEAALLIKMDDPSAPDFNPYPLKWAFIVGVVVALISDCAVFTFTFLPLIYWKKNRTNEGHSRTTAIGIWFFVIQNVWYMFYGALYIWFFIGNTWDNLTMLLLIDYCLRFVENLMYTWPPPVKVINYLSTQLPSTSIQLSNTRRSGQNSSAYDHTSIKILSSEQYNKEMKTEYSPHEQEDKLGLPKKSAHSVISEEHANPYASNVTIINTPSY
ncbi:hypothetical protein BDB01DRAFT_728228 [Pilobolus umbonatus]|nr:hypothetical protein BDB01DRAFT_728228 [Pilobolus umbonatus]